MTQPVDPAPAPPVPDLTPSLPAWGNPAFFLALIPQVATVLTLFFHKDFGLGANTTAYALLASGIVAFGAYIARAVKHHQTGAIWAAYFNLLASGNVPIPAQYGGDGQTVPALAVNSGSGQTTLVTNNVVSPDGENPNAEGVKRPTASTVDPSRIRTGMPSTTRAAKKTARSRRSSG